ncbi:MAG TPA: hypothetical protein VGL94_18090 [Ktedonobacteraceae bacterium]|jgi:hypothetical protein
MKLFTNDIERHKADLIVLGMKIDRLSRLAPEMDAQIAREARRSKVGDGSRHYSAPGEYSRKSTSVRTRYTAHELKQLLPASVRQRFWDEYNRTNYGAAEEDLINRYIRLYRL